VKIQLQNVSFYPKIGGIENYIYYASKTLLKMGNEATILCSQHKRNLPLKDNYEGIKIIRHPLYHLSIPFTLFNPTYRVKELQYFLKNNSDNIDAVWTRHPYYAYASCSTLSKIPIIYIQASVWPLILKYANKRLRRIKKIGFKFQNLQGYYIEKKAMEMSNKIVVLSKIRMKEISDFYNFPKEKFEVIPPGIDLDRFKPRMKDKNLLEEFNIPENAKIVLTIGRLSSEKNIEMLVKAFAQIDYNNCYLMIVGDGPEKLYLKELAKRLEIAGKVKFAGYRENVEKFYSIADVFVLPSKYEGFGHVFLEAMASGLPCIGLKSDYPSVIVASEEIIRNTQTGFFIDPYSVKELSEKIMLLILDENLKHRMGEQARKICEREYDWKKHVEKLIKLSCSLKQVY